MQHQRSRLKEAAGFLTPNWGGCGAYAPPQPCWLSLLCTSPVPLYASLPPSALSPSCRLRRIQDLTQADVTHALSKLRGVSVECVSLLGRVLQVDPQQRLTLGQIMQVSHPPPHGLCSEATQCSSP